MSATENDDDDRTVIRGPAAARAISGEASAPAPSPLTSPGPVPAAAPARANATIHNALPVGLSLGEFEITGLLGEGGFGIVYLAQDHSLQRSVALKEYMPSALAARTGSTQVSVKSERHRETFEAGLKSFVNEARLLAQFDHPSLVKVYRFWEANGTAYMVMPFYEGVTLKDKMREFGGPPDEAWLIALLAPLTEALAVIHAEHCYHRDIAPDNVILLAGSGRPLLLDFGAARRVIGDMTQALTVILKPGYAPVEQYAEVPGMKQGPWTDVYALAASVYWVIMGRTPPPSVARLLSDSYVPLAESAAGRYSQRLLEAIDHALRVRPEERTQTIEALRADLGLAAVPGATASAGSVVPVLGEYAPAPDPARHHAAPVATRTTTGTVPAAATPPGRTGLWIGLGIGVLVLAGAAALFFGTRTRPPPPAAAIDVAPATSPATPPTAAVIVPPPETPVSVPARFEVHDEFDKVVKAQTAGFGVAAVPQKGQLRIGSDRLSFNVTSTRDGFLYVLWNDPDGALYLMFPNKTAKSNKIKAGQTLTLPQSNWMLDTAEPAGKAQLLVIVSKAERDFTSLSKKYTDLFLDLPTGEAGAAAMRGFPGPGSMLAGVPSCDGAGCADYGAAQFSVEVVR